MNINKTWTKEEVKLLRATYGNKPNTEVAQVLNRTVKSVKYKAGTLGLRKTKRYLRSIGR